MHEFPGSFSSVASVFGLLFVMISLGAGPAPGADDAPNPPVPPGAPAAPSAPAAPPAGKSAAPPAKPGASASKDDLYALTMKTLEGKPADLGDHRGKVILFVNVASKCGYTPQYAKLEKLHQKYKDRGLVLIGVPSNDFGGQEPGSSQEIRDFCTKNYGVTFPLMEKAQTKTGEGQSELYALLEKRTGKLPTWNFCKYLVARDGKATNFYVASVEPDSGDFEKAIEAALDGKPLPPPPPPPAPAPGRGAK